MLALSRPTFTNTTSQVLLGSSRAAPANKKRSREDAADTRVAERKQRLLAAKELQRRQLRDAHADRQQKEQERLKAENDAALKRALEIVRAEEKATQQANASSQPASPSTVRLKPVPPPMKRTSAKQSASRDINLRLRRTTSTVPRTVTELASVAIKPAPMPDREDIVFSATSSVFCADSENGVCYWGKDGGRFACPQAWNSLIEWIYARYTAEGDEGTTVEDGTTFSHGEYNLVAALGDASQCEGLELPPLDFDRVVIRVTRSDPVKSNKSLIYRFKPRDVLVREFYHTLHAAANGVGLHCHAAFLFPAVMHEGKQLYGALFVLDRAACDTNDLFDEHSDKMRERGVVGAALTRELHDAGLRVAARVVSLMHHLAVLGAVSVDSKPGNIVFDDENAAHAIDFDSCMYSLMRTGCSWHAHLLHNLALVTAHVRAFRPEALAEGWAQAVGPLMLDLCNRSKHTRWLMRARPNERAYAELPHDTEEVCRQRLEFTAHAYFRKGTVSRFRPVQRADLSLIEQLVRFGLTGVAAPPAGGDDVSRVFAL